MSKTHQGIDRPRGEEQPTDKGRAQQAPQSDDTNSPPKEATRDPKLNDPEKTPGSGMAPGKDSEAPTG